MDKPNARTVTLAFTALSLLLITETRPLVAQPSDCVFSSDLAQFRQAVGSESVGECVEDETMSDSGDRHQRTTRGELVWRHPDGRSVFTNGYETWLNGPDGVVRRLNSDRFAWERDDQQAAAQASPITIASVASQTALATPSANSAPTTTPTAVSQQGVVATLSVADPPDIGGGLRLGGLSGLVPLDRTGTMFMAVTDRGPNKDAKVNGNKVATFLAPSYSPSLVKLRRDQDGVHVVDRIPLRLRQGTDSVTGGPGVSGLPNTSSKEAAYDADARHSLGTDPNGVDTEGIALDPRDGSFWLCEEYGPSILHVASDGTILTRLVPQGSDLKGVGYDVRQVLPPVLLRRKDNRGFEGVAISPEGGTVFAIMQSPLSIPNNDAGEASRSLRVVAVDVSADPRTAAMYLYQTEPASAVGAGRQDAIKVGDLAAVSSMRLLVTERDSGGAASYRKVYQIDLSAATDIKDMAFAQKPLEQMSDGDIDRAGVIPVAKRAVVDLGVMGFDHELVEGLTLVDDSTIAVINDNNFDASEPSELMLIRLADPVW